MLSIGSHRRRQPDAGSQPSKAGLRVIAVSLQPAIPRRVAPSRARLRFTGTASYPFLRCPGHLTCYERRTSSRATDRAYGHPRTLCRRLTRRKAGNRPAARAFSS